MRNILWGEPIDKLKEEYDNLLIESPRYWSNDNYDFNVNFIGLSVLLNCEELIPREIKDFLIDIGKVDWVYAALLGEEGNLPSDSVPLLFSADFMGLKTAVAN